jgi:hypothetical protein
MVRIAKERADLGIRWLTAGHSFGGSPGRLCAAIPAGHPGDGHAQLLAGTTRRVQGQLVPKACEFLGIAEHPTWTKPSDIQRLQALVTNCAGGLFWKMACASKQRADERHLRRVPQLEPRSRSAILSFEDYWQDFSAPVKSTRCCISTARQLVSM